MKGGRCTEELTKTLDESLAIYCPDCAVNHLLSQTDSLIKEGEGIEHGQPIRAEHSDVASLKTSLRTHYNQLNVSQGLNQTQQSIPLYAAQPQ